MYQYNFIICSIELGEGEIIGVCVFFEGFGGDEEAGGGLGLESLVEVDLEGLEDFLFAKG